MSQTADFDRQLAHRRFAAECFDRAWQLLDKPDRSAAEDEEMIRLSHASLWHWTQVADHSQQNLSIGYWQLARIYSVLGHAAGGVRYGRMCLASSGGLPPFFGAYAHEALARAAAVGGNRAEAESHLSEARRLAEAVADDEDRAALLNDLDTIL